MQMLQLNLMVTVALHWKVVLWSWILQHWELIRVETMCFWEGIFHPACPQETQVTSRSLALLQMCKCSKGATSSLVSLAFLKYFMQRLFPLAESLCWRLWGAISLSYPVLTGFKTQSFKIHLTQLLSLLIIVLVFYFPWHDNFLVKALFQWQFSKGKKSGEKIKHFKSWLYMEHARKLTVHVKTLNK